jgi:Protein of unknown function (DUF4235)
VWRLVSIGITLAAAAAAKKAVEVAWVAIDGDDPPVADDPEADLRRVIAFAAATAAAVAVAQIIGNRGVARAKARLGSAESAA